ncbi:MULTISPECIES: hypothetical protein [Pseudoalteromonas]|jgi:hypothetical protein|uniref:Uncharacterized protein n=1 Tax=Pseudoalteromonas aliena SW19 TaxID=1314866 RepID=A0ABR9E642_9GAMM|nr:MULTISPECIES: hypothetical protein [Pseudoalteromonas]MBE0361420.1 hypothetical protein [Pseudoalteromonas aliena SW19]
MPVCDGNNCSNNIPWRITSASLQVSSRTEKFKIDEIKKVLNQVIRTAYGGCSNVINVAAKGVVFKNYCNKCWSKQAASWGDIETYKDARAKTDSTGIYFQVLSPSFIVNHSPDLERILSCACHELMHYWSHNSMGLQDYNRTINVDWDEAVADLLGYLTYKEYFRGRFKKYITPYNKYPKCIDLARQSFMSRPKFQWNKIIEGGDERAQLPTELKLFFDKQAWDKSMPQVLKLKASDIVSEILFSSLVKWFFNGPHERAPSIGKNCREFLTANGIQKLINTSQVFPAYAGYDTEHIL